MTTKYLEDFLNGGYPPEARRFLWQYHARHKNYAKAATTLLALAKNEPDLADRIEWLQKVAQFARAAGLASLVRDASLLLQLARIEGELFGGSADSPPAGASSLLFNKALSTGRWDLALELLSFLDVEGAAPNPDGRPPVLPRARSERAHVMFALTDIDAGKPTSAPTPVQPAQSAQPAQAPQGPQGQSRPGAVKLKDKRQVVSTVWVNMLHSQFAGVPIAKVHQAVVTWMQKIPPGNPVLEESLVIQVLEDFRLNRRAGPLWALNTALGGGLNGDRLLEAYLEALEEKDRVGDRVRADFTYAALALIDLGARTQKSVAEHCEWFRRNAGNQPYYDAVSALVAELVKKNQIVLKVKADV
jgi:hypothetical protein